MNMSKSISVALFSASLMLALGNTALAASTVNLGTAAGFAVLAGSTVTNTGS